MCTLCRAFVDPAQRTRLSRHSLPPDPLFAPGDGSAMSVPQRGFISQKGNATGARTPLRRSSESPALKMGAGKEAQAAQLHLLACFSALSLGQPKPAGDLQRSPVLLATSISELLSSACQTGLGGVSLGEDV